MLAATSNTILRGVNCTLLRPFVVGFFRSLQVAFGVGGGGGVVDIVLHISMLHICELKV